MTTTLAPSSASPDLRGRPGVLPVAVLGLGADLPETVVTNDELPDWLETSDEWIRTRTGIAQRHVVAPGEATSDMATRAAERALADAGMDATDLAMVLVATTTADHPVPGTAPTVATNLGLEVAALDLNAACSGFVYGLQVAAGLLATGVGPVLLVGAESMTRIQDPHDRGVSVLFGDGAGAVVLGADDDGALGPFDLGADGTDPSILWQEAGGAAVPPTPDQLAAGHHFLTMRGREVYRHAVARMTSSSRAVLERAGLTVDDVDLLVGHQANKRILDAVGKGLGIGEDRCHVTVDRHANTSAASIPLALADARDTGAVTAGDLVLLTAFGAGLTWGSTLLRWTDTRGPR